MDLTPEQTWNKADTSTASVTDDGSVSTIKEYTALELWEQAWALAGKTLFYMQFIWPHIDFGPQVERINNMCYHLAKEHDNHIKDTEENREWFRQWIKEFEDETENQC